MTKFMLAKVPKNKPMMFYNVALGEWVMKSSEATKMHRLVAKELFEELCSQGSVKIFPVMVDSR